MKHLFIAAALGLGIASAQADEVKPDLSLIIDANEYTHEVRLGFVPHYIVWAQKGQPLERAARAVFQPHFSEITACEGNDSADAVLWLQSRLTYNPMMMTYYADVTARWFRSDGKPIETIKATGTAMGHFGSRLVEQHVQTAYDQALRDIGAQFEAHATEKSIDRSLPKSPCALVTLLPKP